MRSGSGGRHTCSLFLIATYSQLRIYCWFRVESVTKRVCTDRQHHDGEPADDEVGPGRGCQSHHGHTPSLRSRLAHGISGVLGTHSHDPADHEDATLEADTEGRRALSRSLGILAVTAGFQLVVVSFSGSVAVLG